MIRSLNMTRTSSKTETSRSWCVTNSQWHARASSLTRTAQVDGMLYCVHRFFFSRDSVYFSTRLAQLGTRDHEALTTVISLGDVEREDFEALLAVIYPK